MRHCGWLLGLLSLFSLATHASDWQEIKNEAKGQTVWFNAWGGDTAINRYLDWVSGEMKTHYAINLKIVRLADAADAVKRIQTEVAAGRKTGGSVDLLWVNGENFRTLKEANLLQTGWAETLPNWRYVDTQLPVREDFSVPTEGAESPWGGAQLTFIARRDVTPQPPQTPQALLEFAKANPGTVTYPRPPDFTGTAFLEQLLIMLTPDPTALKDPPTLAVISWQWLTQGDADQQTKGALASLLLMLLLAAYVLLGYLLWRGWRRTIPRVDGVRKPATPLLPGNTLASFLPLTGVLCVVLLAILADQSTINSEALINSLTMGLVAAFISLLLLLLWLEWGPQRRQLWLWLPILLPALPLVAGQYTLALWLNLDGSWTAVVWGHLLWVMPWMLFILQPAWQRIDSRLILIAQTLGWSRAKIFFYVKCPLMLRPALIAFAVGFSVSIAQYMPTLWLGAGRFPTLTTEAVALSSGGSNGILAAQALWQLLLPLIIFALTALVAKWVGYVRQGLR